MRSLRLLALMFLTGCSAVASTPTGRPAAGGMSLAESLASGAASGSSSGFGASMPASSAAGTAASTGYSPAPFPVPGYLEVVIRWPAQDHSGFRVAAIPTSTRLIRLTVRDSGGIRRQVDVTRPADGAGQAPVLLDVAPGNNLSLEVAAYRDAAGTGEPIARGTSVGLVVMSAVTTPVRLVLDALFVPTVASMSTNVGAPGDAVTLYGSHLDAVEGQLPEVRFGGSGLAEVLSAASDSLRVRLPADARVGEVSVVRDGIRWPGRGVFWPFDPTALRIESPKQAWDPRPADVRLVLQGQQQAYSAPEVPWLWGGVGPSDTWGPSPSLSPDWFVDPPVLGAIGQDGVFVPGTMEGTGSVAYRVAGRVSDRLGLVTRGVPTVASMSTNVGVPGDAVTLYGSHLDAVEGKLPAVRFGGSGLAEVLAAASDSLRVRLPADARVGEVSVIRDGIRWPGRGVFWPFDPAALRIESPKQAWDPRPADERLVVQGATCSFSVPPDFWLWPDGVPTDAAGVPPWSWSVEPAALGSVSDSGQFLAGATDGTGDIRLSVGGLSASPQDIEVARLDFSVATSSMVFDPNFGDAFGTRQLGAQLRLSSGEDLSAYLRYESDDPAVCTVSATGDVRVLDISADQTVQVRVTNDVDGRSISVPVEVRRDRILRSGTFQMGSTEYLNATQHQVTLTQDFLMQMMEVTQGQWRALMGNNPSTFTGDDNRPVDRVSWYDAVAYANALSAKDGLPNAYDLSSCSGTPGTGTYYCNNVTLTASTPYATAGWRLPTEAEWEYAYRAGTTTPWFFGSESNLLGMYAWFDSNSGGKTHPVGQKQPNAWGLYDMAGNVWEWCWDWYAAYPGAVTDPTGPASGLGRVCRGGSWAYAASIASAAFRGSDPPDTRGSYSGFRLSRSRP